ncbi:D-aminoacyl-tRNA deacylase [Candidatus Nitronereus thalassa]|uniref:D-aminoacyl-tRNA deacylase n=1 Tax=Candidatus Nitronereus thalassa TaxID=3020898 RepID=A0ABU3K8D1_9BACT|nr:D-aminoacyl-tRNA deacylase [Candidatus Nitronereus thalassa]MDT7042656.1 D-aminoacyl-tRNA deacylase [Candidatus Nitronereus thalassa]
MKAVIQRVLSASVEVEQKSIGQIGAGLLVLLGAEKGDTPADVDYMVEKIPHLRIFSDDQGKMNRSLMDCGGELLVVSQFTLLGDTHRGRRPGFDQAASPDLARHLYDSAIANFREKGIPVQTGMFGANMLVSLKNDGPVTFTLDSRKGISGNIH